MDDMDLYANVDEDFIVIKAQRGDDVELKLRGHDGGDLIFQTGVGQPAGEKVQLPGNTGDFIFKVGDTEVMRIKGDGSFIVKGEQVGYQKDVYDGFRAWLSEALSLCDSSYKIER